VICRFIDFLISKIFKNIKNIKIKISAIMPWRVENLQTIHDTTTLPQYPIMSVFLVFR